MVEIVFEPSPTEIWVNIRIHRLSTLTFVRIFSQFTTDRAVYQAKTLGEMCREEIDLPHDTLPIS